MFSPVILVSVALAAVSSVQGYIVPRRDPPPGWAFGYLEEYTVYHTRYLAINCQDKHNTQFFDDCCHPLLATETLEKNRPSFCKPSASASASASAAEPTSTVDIPADDIPVVSVTSSLVSSKQVLIATTSIKSTATASSSAAKPTSNDDDEYEDCDEEDEDDDEEDCEDEEDDEPVSSAAAPASTPAATKPAEATSTKVSSSSVEAAPAKASSSSVEAAPTSSKVAATSSSKAEEAPAPTTTAKATSSSAQAPAPTSSSTSSGGNTITGPATFYFQNNVAGACGAVNGDDTKIVALRTNFWGDHNSKSQHCGQSVRITNPKNNKSVVAVVADECPTCEENGIDLSTGAFDQIGARDDGSITVKWEFL